MKYLVDTTIFVKQLRGDEQSDTFLRNKKDELGISYITWGELLQGVRRKQHSQAIALLMQPSKVVWGSRRIEKQAIDLLQQYFSKGLNLFDALIAATAMEHKLILVTHNAKHFQGIRGLKVELL